MISRSIQRGGGHFQETGFGVGLGGHVVNNLKQILKVQNLPKSLYEFFSISDEDFLQY